VERVLIAFDRDEAGDRGASAVAERLMGAGIAAFRIQFPKGMDANAYALGVTPAPKSLGVLIRKAQWLGNGRAPAITSAVDPLGTSAETIPEPAPHPVSAAETEPVAPPPEPLAAAMPPAPAPDPVEAQSDHELVMVLENRRYRIRGWKKPLNPENLKVNLLVAWMQRGRKAASTSIRSISMRPRRARPSPNRPRRRRGARKMRSGTTLAGCC
jgi:hypothetical protein